MPTTYAHWKFGDAALKNLPEDPQKTVNQYRTLFDYGVHGPDIFFYYKVIKGNEINEFGDYLHGVAMRDILADFKKNYQTSGNKDASLAYILGFLAHFTLDSYCHGYIDLKAETEGPSHGKIESQYDRHLLIKDGRDPVKTSVTTSLRPSRYDAAVIAHLFNRYSDEEFYGILKDMKFYLDLLKDDSDVKRFLLETAMKAAKRYKYLDLLITKVNEPSCVTSNMRLDKYFATAAEHYPLLAASVMEYLEDGKELPSYFNNHFGPKPDYKDIPILSQQEEKDYTVGLQK